MVNQTHDTPLLNQLEDGPWPSFETGLKNLSNDNSKPYANMMKDLLGQLEHSYETRMGYWKGGTVSVFLVMVVALFHASRKLQMIFLNRLNFTPCAFNLQLACTITTQASKICL